MQRANAAVPGLSAALAGPGRGDRARWRCSSCRRTAMRCGRRNCATATPIRHSPPQVAASAGAHPRRHRRRLLPSRPTSRPTRIFYDIRLEPYLVATARAHPDLAPQLCMAWSSATQGNRRALVHGDVSPKNILRGPAGPVFLDAECAWWGDPAFDLAFCLNHLLLKCLWTPAATRRLPRLLRCARRDLLSPASPGSRRPRWKPAPRICCRGCSSPGWMASRRSSTSPPRRTRNRVRRTARALLLAPVETARRCAPGLEEGTRRMTDTSDRLRARPPRLGQPRPPDGGGRGPAGGRRRRPRHRAGRRVHRHRRGARPARRRRRRSAATT